MRTHGSSKGGFIDALQVSVPESELNTPQKSAKVTRALAASIAKFMLKHDYITGVPHQPIDAHFDIIKGGTTSTYITKISIYQYCLFIISIFVL